LGLGGRGDLSKPCPTKHFPGYRAWGKVVGTFESLEQGKIGHLETGPQTKKVGVVFYRKPCLGSEAWRKKGEIERGLNIFCLRKKKGEKVDAGYKGSGCSSVRSPLPLGLLGREKGRNNTEYSRQNHKGRTGD